MQNKVTAHFSVELSLKQNVKTELWIETAVNLNRPGFNCSKFDLKVKLIWALVYNQTN